MAFEPSAHQKVEIVDVVRGIANNLRNVVDACGRSQKLFEPLATEVQAEVEKVLTVERFLEIKAMAAAVEAEIRASILAYEGEQGLPTAEE